MQTGKKFLIPKNQLNSLMGSEAGITGVSATAIMHTSSTEATLPRIHAMDGSIEHIKVQFGQ